MDGRDKMTRLTVETFIEAPIESVFEAFLDVGSHPEWSQNLLNSTSFEVLEKTQSGVGTRWRKWVHPQKGAEGWQEGRIVEAERPSRIVTETTTTLDIQGQKVVMSGRTTRTLEALEGGRTRVREEASQPDTGFLFRMLVWFKRKKMQQLAESEARALSEFLRSREGNLG